MCRAAAEICVAAAHGPRSFSQPPGELDVARLRYANAAIALRDIAARTKRWTAAIDDAASVTDPSERRSRLERLESMIFHEAALHQPAGLRSSRAAHRAASCSCCARTAPTSSTGREDDDTDEDADLDW